MKKAFGALLVSVLIVSCASQDAGDPRQFEKAPLFGMMYDEDNQPCSGVNLLLDGATSAGNGIVTDVRGRFVLPGLSRGEHAVVARKDGYEELSVKIQFLNRTDVLFLRMVSFGQLLADAEKALEDRRWDQAEGFLARAEKLDARDAALLYLRAVRSYKAGSHADAAMYLHRLLEEGIREPAVYLFLADLYERHLSDRQKAIENLELYLARKADDEAQKRLAALKRQEEE